MFWLKQNSIFTLPWPPGEPLSLLALQEILALSVIMLIICLRFFLSQILQLLVVIKQNDYLAPECHPGSCWTITAITANALRNILIAQSTKHLSSPELLHLVIIEKM